MNNIYILLLFLLIGCNSNHSEEKENKATHFEINPTQKNIIQGDKNGILVIPKDCFVDKGGNLIKESIQIKLTEANSIADIVNKGLDTRAGDAILVTGGMMNIEATTTDGNAVEIAPGNTITFQKEGTLLDTNQYKFFTQSAQQDWEKPENPSPYLTYLPLAEQVKLYISLYNNDSMIVSEKKSPKHKEIFGDEPFSARSFLDGAGQYFNGVESTVIPEEVLDKSFLASKEYEERYRMFPTIGEYWVSVHFAYLRHLDKPLYVADSFALEVLKEELTYYEKKKDLAGIRLYKEKCQVLTTFKNQHKTTFSPDRFTDEERKKLKDFYKKMQTNTTISSFSIRQLGWHNIDYFYKKELMQETLLKIKYQEGTQKVMLVLKNDKVVLRASKNADNSFCFSKNNECLTKLPFVPAYLIALGEQDGQLLFAKKEIQIGENEVEELELKPSSEAEVSAALQGIEAGYIK